MAEKHFYEQVNYTRQYLVSYLEKNIKGFDKSKKILDIGCAEGGTVYELRQQGYICDGIEIDSGRAKIAENHIGDLASITVGDITKSLRIKNKYDIVIMRDVIEHIDEKEKALANISSLLTEKGALFITFPLKFSPYAGHNQTAKNWLKYFWYITLLPKPIIKLIVPQKNASGLLYLKKNALSYYKLNQLVKKDWNFIRKDFFISRPIFKIRFGWKIVKLPNIPIIREFVNGCEVLIEKKHITFCK